YGALVGGGGAARMLRLEPTMQRAEIVHTGPELVLVYAQLRADCEARGHALAQRAPTADRWTPATARRLGVPLVSNDITRKEKCSRCGLRLPSCMELESGGHNCLSADAVVRREPIALLADAGSSSVARVSGDRPIRRYRA